MARKLKIAIAGGSAAGLLAALKLARAGHEVVVLEQHRTEPSSDLELAANRAFRSSAPQIVQPHVIMAKCRQLILHYFPDLYEHLIAAGVAEAPLSTQMPPSLVDKTRRSDDEQFTML